MPKDTPLRTIWEGSGMTQRLLAREADVPETYLSHLINGRIKHPKVDTAQRLARALKVRVEDIFPMAKEE